MSKKVFGTKEWAKHSANATTGCSHNCIYCYSKDSYEKKGNTIPWTEERPNQKALDKVWGKREGTIMFPTSHDITPNNIEYCLVVLNKLLKEGNNVLIVSKPHIECIKSLCFLLEKYKEQILFRFTIGSSNNEVLKFWEPEAPLFEERLECLKYAFENGYNTSISCEPLLDNELSTTITLVDKLSPYITNSLWIGKMNKAEIRVSGIEDKILNEYLDLQNDDNVLKIYEHFKDNEIIRWKESIKEVVGIEVPTEKGLDI